MQYFGLGLVLSFKLLMSGREQELDNLYAMNSTPLRQEGVSSKIETKPILLGKEAAAGVLRWLLVYSWKVRLTMPLVVVKLSKQFHDLTQISSDLPSSNTVNRSYLLLAVTNSAASRDENPKT